MGDIQNNQNTDFANDVKKEKISFTLIFSIIGFLIFFGPIIAYAIYFLFTLPQYFVNLMWIALIIFCIIVAIFLGPVFLGAFVDNVIEKVDQLKANQSVKYSNLDKETPIDYNNEKIMKKIKNGKLSGNKENNKILEKTQKVLEVTSKVIIAMWLIKIIGKIFNVDTKVGR